MTFDTNSILTVLIVQSSRAAVLILAILLLRFLVGKRIPPAWRHAIWGLVPLQLLLVVSIPSSVSLLNIVKSVEFGAGSLELAEVEQKATSRQIPAISLDIPIPDTQPDVTPEIVFDNFGAAPDEDKPVLSEAELAQLALIANTLAEMNSAESDEKIFNEIPTVADETAASIVAETATSDPEVVIHSTGSFNLKLVILAVWGMGCCVMIVVFVRQIMRCRRWVARGKPVTSEPVLQLFEESCRRMKIKTWLVVAESSMVRGPFLIGAIRPKLLLPHRMVESASPKQLQAVFLHELAHLKRWDIWTGWLMTLLLIVHWFNPLLWIAIRRMNADREEACDVMAMNTLDRLQQGDYAHSLLDIAQQFIGPTHAPGLVGISETGKFLARRIDMLKQIGTWKLRWKVLAVGLALLIAAVTLTDAQEKKENKPKPGNIVVDGVEYAPVTKDEPKPQPREEESRSIAGRYESDGSYVDLISVMQGVYKINMTKKSDIYEGMASRNGNQMRVEFLSYGKVDVTFVDGQTIPEVRQGPVPDSLQSLTVDIKQDENGLTSLVFPETELWKAFEVSLAEPEIVPRDLNGGFRGTLDGKIFVMELIAAYNSSEIPPNLGYSVNVSYSGSKHYAVGTAVIQGKELKLDFPLPLNVPRLQQKPQILLAIDKDDSGKPVLTVKSDPAPDNFPKRLTKITSNAEWQEIEEQWELERLKTTGGSSSFNNDRKLFSEIQGFYHGRAGEQDVSITLLDKNTAMISTAGPNGTLQEKYQPKNPDAAFVVTFDVGYNTSTSYSCFGEASFVNENELEILFFPKDGLPFPESLKEKLTVQIVRDNDGVTLVFPKTELWDEFRVGNKSSSSTVPTQTSNTPVSSESDPPFWQFLGNYEGTQGDQRIGLALNLLAVLEDDPEYNTISRKARKGFGGEMIKSSQHSISIMIYENGLPPQNTPNATTAITDVVHYPRYYGTATLVSDNEMRIELRGHLDKNGINTESVPESLKNLTATIGTVGTPIKPESKFFVPTWTLTIPKTEVWDEIRVTQVPQVEEAASASPHDQQEIAQLKQQLLEKEYSIAQLRVELSKSDRAPIPRLPTIDESTGTATVIMSNDPPQPVKPRPSKSSMVQKDIDNMKQLVLGLHNYHDVYKSLPSASTADKDGKPLHSWRVALLPYLGYAELYEKIRHNEPWDSEYNRQFYNQMPDVYRSSYVSDEHAEEFANEGFTRYAVVTGKEAIFAGPNHWAGFQRITDGTSNTVAFVLRNRAVCWMDPNSDVPFDLATLGFFVHPDGIGALTVPSNLSDLPVTPMAFADGRVDLVRTDLPQDYLRAILTCNGGEAIHINEYTVDANRFENVGNTDPEPQTVVIYELPPSADPNKFLEIVKTLLQVEHDASAVLSADRTSLRFEGSLSDHEKVEILLDMFKSPQKSDEPLSIAVAVYTLKSIPAETALPVLQTALKDRPDVKIMAKHDTNSIIVHGRNADHEKAREVITTLDKTPPMVNPGTTSTLPWYGPTPPDPVAGKYLATDEDGRQIGFELTRQEAAPALQGWPLPNTTMPSPTTYRIVMYEGGLPDDGFKEDRGRMIGTATFNGHKLDVEWELSHDGKRYNVLTSERQSGRLLRDGETMLLLLSSGENNTEGMVAAKVKEEKPVETPYQR